MPLPPDVEAVVNHIVGLGRRSLSLNELADLVIDKRSIGYAEIELIIDAVEAQGIEVAPPAAEPSETLAAVLAAARTLRAELGRAPTAEEIAKRTGLDATDVHAALTYARTLST